MLSGISLALSEVPLELIEAHKLQQHIYERGGEKEIQFLLGIATRTLPVWLNGQLQIVRWGTQRGQSRLLPLTAWTTTDSVAKGRWANVVTREVVIPATLALDRGVWYRVREGIRGLVVYDLRGLAVVYPMVEPASHYYRVMTRCEWSPALVGDAI